MSKGPFKFEGAVVTYTYPNGDSVTFKHNYSFSDQHHRWVVIVGFAHNDSLEYQCMHEGRGIPSIHTGEGYLVHAFNALR